MPKYGKKHVLAEQSTPDIGEPKFDRYGLAKIVSWKMEKNWGFGLPKCSYKW